MFDTVLNTPMMDLNIRKKSYHNIQKIFMVDNLFKRYAKLSENQDFLSAVCKLRHRNLGIGTGIGIGTDITNAIISSSIRPIDPKLSRVVT